MYIKENVELRYIQCVRRKLAPYRIYIVLFIVYFPVHVVVELGRLQGD